MRLIRRSMVLTALVLAFAGRASADESQTVIHDLAGKTEEKRRQLYEQARSVILASRRSPAPPFKATVIQALRGSRHLVESESKTTFLLELLPERGSLPRGTPVSCAVDYVGVYQYNSVEGVPRRVKHLRELTEDERTGKRWKTYPEFCQWLKQGNVCELRKSEKAPCQACSATGAVPDPASGKRKPCERCQGSGRESRVTLHHLVWNAPPQPAAAP